MSSNSGGGRLETVSDGLLIEAERKIKNDQKQDEKI